MSHQPDAWIPISNKVSMVPVLRALLQCSTKVEHVAARHMESLGLTPSRFDVLSALGDTPGMTVKDLCETALITKGTVLPVITSLEKLGLVQRAKGPQDSRQTIVSLTPAGQALYEETFMVHVDHMRAYFDGLTAEDQRQLVRLLGKVEDLFTP